MSRVSDALPRAAVGMMALVVAPLFLVWACGSPINVQPLTSHDISSLQSAGKYHDEYIIIPDDTLQIRYTFHPEMNQEVVVQPDGKITASLLGRIAVGGMTTKRVGELLVEKASDQLRDPEVVVNIMKFAERNVYVGGEVKKEGPVRYRKGLSPLQAIIAAGGLTDSARADSVILVRRIGESDHDTISRKLNLVESVAEGREQIFLAPEDIVYVPKTWVSEANLWVKQHIVDLFPFFRASTGVTYRGY